MHSIFRHALELALVISFLPISALAAPRSDDPLCLPGAYSVDSDCQPYGSWQYQHQLSEKGLTLPLQPLPAARPDPGLTQLPFYYARVNTANAPIFASVDDAVVGKNPIRTLEAGLVYVTYQDVVEVGGKSYYMIDIGQWMRRGDITPNQVYSQFMGLELQTTPATPFGWVIEFAGSDVSPFDARTAPSASAGFSGQLYNAYQVVQVYDIQEADGTQWYMVGPDRWLDSRFVRLVFPSTTPPEGVDNGRWIEVNLEQQTLAVYQDGEMVFATLIATGLPGVWTRPGLFQVYEKHESTLMRGVFTADRSDYYFLEDVPWTMYFDEARALHGAYWRARFGYEQSHGCVNLSVADSHWLFNWATVGDWVWVHDPSGRTPSDFEGAGGA